MLSDSAILKKIEHQPKHTAGFKRLFRELAVHGDERQDLHDSLDRMARSGQLLKVESDRYVIPQAATGKNLIVGRLSMHRDGFGFVLPDPTSLDDRLKARLSGDIFIPPPAVGSAMHGDRVLVEMGTIRPDGRAEGRIVRPVNRAHPTVVGIFHYGHRNYVTPIDQKIAQEIIIPPGMDYPELRAGSKQQGSDSHRDRKKRSPHRVLGEEAAQRTDWDDLENVVVDVEITDWPTATQNPRGRVIEILGYADDFGVDVEIIIRKFHLPHQFPAQVLEEAEAVEPLISSHELHKRRDFRQLPIVTIDGETARDFDDAVTVHRLDNGNFELQVHIADVAHYVMPASALDQEARLRGTSVYFPDRAVPMLPLELSTDICSLRPRVDRLVMSCIMEIDHQGEVVRYELCPGVMLSANECVAAYLENKRVASLYRIHEKPDAKRVYDFEVIAATFGYSLGVGALPIQRIQFKTDRRASYGTGKRAREIEIPKEIHITPRMYQKLTEKIAGKPEDRILSYLMLRSLKQARYSEENLGHFALAAKTYTHFTSPIRRYPDLIVHRILKEVLRDSAERWEGQIPIGVSGRYESREGGATPWSKRREHAPTEPLGGPISIEELHDIAEESSQTERRSDEAERELMEWKKVKFMQDRVGDDFDGLIISVTKFGFFVELTDLFIEGLVPLASLTADDYTYHENTREIIGQRSRKTYRLGQRIRVLVDRIDPVEKKIQFAIVEEQKRQTAKRKRR